jgi:hypothetical protein
MPTSSAARTDRDPRSEQQLRGQRELRGYRREHGAFGPFFHPPYTDPSYAAERDEGWLVRVAIEKTTNTLERAHAASEWRDPTENSLCVGQGGGLLGFLCATNTATPGVENPTQNLECGSPCEAFLDTPAELTD